MYNRLFIQQTGPNLPKDRTPYQNEFVKEEPKLSFWLARCFKIFFLFQNLKNFSRTIRSRYVNFYL
jgi:hypothetical protein